VRDGRGKSAALHVWISAQMTPLGKAKLPPNSTPLAHWLIHTCFCLPTQPHMHIGANTHVSAYQLNPTSAMTQTHMFLPAN